MERTLVCVRVFVRLDSNLLVLNREDFTTKKKFFFRYEVCRFEHEARMRKDAIFKNPKQRLTAWKQRQHIRFLGSA